MCPYLLSFSIYQQPKSLIAGFDRLYSYNLSLLALLLHHVKDLLVCEQIPVILL